MKNRWIIIALALAAACAFALSVQMGRWWSIAGQVEIGPFGSRHCFQGECRSAGLGWTGGTELWMRLGIATWAGGLVAMLALVIVAGALAAKRIPRLAAKSALVAIATATLAGVAFIVQAPRIDGSAIDRGIYAFIAAVVLGTLAMVLILRAPTAAAAPTAPRVR